MNGEESVCPYSGASNAPDANCRTLLPRIAVMPSRYLHPSVKIFTDCGVTLAVASPSVHLLAGQATTLNVTVRSAAGVADTITLQLFPAVMSGWQARLTLDSDDEGAGPINLLLAANGMKVVGVQITAGAEAQPGEAGEAILRAASQRDAAATPSISVNVSVMEQ